MRRFLAYIIIAVLFPAMSASANRADSLCVDTLLTVQQKIDSLLESPMFKTSQVALMAWNLDKDTLIYAHNEQQVMRPASTLKLLTSITALDLLSKDHMLCTQVYGDGSCDSTGYNGNIYIKGCMDPSLTEEDFNAIVSVIDKLQGDTIRGRLVTDLSFKDSERMGKGWCWDDDNPVLSPLLYKRKDNFLELLHARLASQNIFISGTDSIGVVPSGAKLLGERCSTIGSLLPHMLKSSDNLYAESAFYHLSAGRNWPATQRASVEVEKNELRKLGLNPDDYKIVDGSGLSLYNYISALAEVKLLRYAYSNKQIFSFIYNALPVAGVNGTVKSRLKNTPLQGNVHAKTGTLTGVSTLAGYLTNKNGEMLAFCIFNQGILSAKKAKDFQDDILKVLY